MKLYRVYLYDINDESKDFEEIVIASDENEAKSKARLKNMCLLNATATELNEIDGYKINIKRPIFSI